MCDQNAFELLALAWYAVAGAPPVNAALCFILCAGPAAVVLSTAAYGVLMSQICISQGDCAAGVSMVCHCWHSRCECNSVMYKL